MMERKISKGRHLFGTGAIEGVAGPEAANNAAAQTSFIPLLTLGIPSNAVMALMVGALIIQGIQPGPRMVEAQPDLFWGLIASMWIGNVMLLVINLPMIGMWVKLLQVPYKFLYPAILVFCSIGAYSVNNNVFDVYSTVLFAVFGYMFNKLKLEPAPLLIGFVLGPMMEEHLRRAMLLSRGDVDGLLRAADQRQRCWRSPPSPCWRCCCPTCARARTPPSAADPLPFRSVRMAAPGQPGAAFLLPGPAAGWARQHGGPIDGHATGRQGRPGHRRLGRPRPHHRQPCWRPKAAGWPSSPAAARCWRRLAAELPAGADPLVIVEDLTDPAAAPRIRDAVLGRFGRCDILVNNAGGSRAQPPGELGEEAIWQEAMELNFHAARRMTHALVPAMQAAGLRPDRQPHRPGRAARREPGQCAERRHPYLGQGAVARRWGGTASR